MYSNVLIIASALLFLGVSASAEDRTLTEKNASCEQIKKEIGMGIDAKNVTRNKIREGLDAGAVIRCAILAGGQPQKVIAGAKEAGAPSEHISRSAIDACAEANRLFESNNNLCSIMKSDIAKGLDPRKVIRDKIRGGNNACSAIQCAIASGTDLRQVFAGAKEAGITSDILSRCSLNACVDPARVASVEQDIGVYGLGYSYYDEDFMPIDTTVPRKGIAGASESGASSYEISRSAVDAYPEEARLFEINITVSSIVSRDIRRSFGPLFRSGRGTEGRVLSPSKFPPSLPD
jgi:hypothetical protein